MKLFCIVCGGDDSGGGRVTCDGKFVCVGCMGGRVS
jgi:hypothetical protein